MSGGPEPDLARFEFTVPGKAQPKQRPRRAKSGVWYTPKETRKYEKHVAETALAHGVRPIQGPVRMEINVYWPDLRRRDTDNAAKSIGDGLNGIAFDDDYQVAQLVVTKHLDRDNPRAEVIIEEMAE